MSCLLSCFCYFISFFSVCAQAQQESSHIKIYCFDSSEKTPAAQLKRQVTVSPSLKSVEDEIIYLRSQNKLLKNALNAVKNTASDKLRKSYELVWYARNRSKYRGRELSRLYFFHYYYHYGSLLTRLFYY